MCVFSGGIRKGLSVVALSGDLILKRNIHLKVKRKKIPSRSLSKFRGPGDRESLVSMKARKVHEAGAQ